MKLLYVENGFGFAKGISGGSVRVAEIGKRLQDLGVKVSVLTTSTGYKVLKALDLNVEYYVLNSPPGLEKTEFISIGRVLSYFFEIVKVLPLVSFLCRHDIICSSSDYLCDTIPVWLHKRRHANAKWVAFVHHLINIPWKRKGNLLINLLSYISQQISFRLIRNKADLIFLLKTPEGHHAKSLLMSLGVSSQRMSFTKNGVDKKFIENIPDTDKLYDVCSSVALQAIRGGFDILPICKYVRQHKNDAQFMIIARGSNKAIATFKRSLKCEGLSSNVTVTGHVKRETYLKGIKSSKVYVSPKYEEGWGIAVCEAMSCGTPVVVYDLPAYEIFGDAIVRVPIGDRLALAKASLDLLSNQKRRNEMSQKSKKIAAKFDWNQIANTELSIISKLCTT